MSHVDDIEQMSWNYYAVAAGVNTTFGMSDPEDPGLEDRLREAIAQFAVGDLDALTAMAEQMSEASTQLTARTAQSLTDASIKVADWSGSAADSFKQYLAQVQDSFALQSVYSLGLVYAFRCHSGLMDAMYRDLADLAEKTNKGLEEAEVRLDKIGLAIAGVVLAVVTAGAGAVAEGVAAVVVTGLVTAAGQAPSVMTEVIDGDSKLEVLQAFEKALGVLRTRLDGEVARVRRMLDYLLQSMRSDRMAPVLQPNSSAIITSDAFDPGKFQLPGDEQPAGVNDRVDRTHVLDEEDYRKQKQDEAEIGKRLNGE